MSPAQLDANRANAQHSTGPVTEAGRKIVGHNALKHGLTGKTHAALPGEESAFEQHCRSYRDACAPVGLLEEELVRSIAEHSWRLRRAHAMENELFDRTENETGHDAATLSESWLDPRKGFQRIALYAARIQRALDKATSQLQALQAERKAACEKAREEAVLLTQLALAKEQTFDPAEAFDSPESHGGFVYSSEEILRLIIRADRLAEARALLESKQNPSHSTEPQS